MSRIEEMQKRHRMEIEKLQEECKHEKETDWMELQWAPGHSSGCEVRLCLDCNKEVGRREMGKYVMEVK